MSLSPWPNATARLARGPFALAVVAVYLLSFVSQMLLSGPVTAHLGVAPFALVQAGLIGVWIALHRRRLRDAGRPSGIVIGVALVYALEVVLLIIVVGLMVGSTAADGAGPEATILHLFVVLYFLFMFTGDPNLGVLQLWLLGFGVIMLLPIVIALGFSLWAATRPSVTAAP